MQRFRPSNHICLPRWLWPRWSYRVLILVWLFCCVIWATYSNSCIGLQSTRFFCPWNSPDKISEVGSHSLLLGIFPTQGLNLGLPHCRQILYHLSHQGSPTLTLQASISSSVRGLQIYSCIFWRGLYEVIHLKQYSNWQTVPPSMNYNVNKINHHGHYYYYSSFNYFPL